MQKVISKKEIEKEIKFSNGELINEGYWEDFKYYTAKLTKRYKADGKIFGKAKVDAAAKAKIDTILNKAGNEVIRNLDNFIKQTNPEFPNNRKGDDFLATILHIANIYESLVNATKIQPNEKGFLPVDAANEIIADLREYVKKALDTDLYAVYSGLDEAEEIDLEAEDIQLGEDNILNELEAADVRSNLKSRRGAGDDFASTRIDTLKSNKLPLLLAGLGTSLGGLSWLTSTDFFKQLFTTKSSIKEIFDSLRETLNYNAIRPGEGLTQIMNRTQGLGLSPSSSPQEFLQGVAKIGGGNLNRGIDLLTTEGGIFPNPDGARSVLEKIAANPNGYGDSLGQIFQGNWAGTGAQAGDLLVTKPGGILFNIIVSAIKKEVVKTTTTTATAYFAAKGLGSILGPVGIGLIGAGALVKLFRMKGLRQSRAATLNDLYQMLREVAPTKSNDTIIGLPPASTDDKETKTGEEKPQGGEGQEQQPQGGEEQQKTPVSKPISNLTKVLRNLFRDVYDVQTNPNLLPEAENKKINYIKRGGLEKDAIGFSDDLDKKNKSVFIRNMRRMMAVAKAINTIYTTKLTDDGLIRLLQNVKQDGLHDIMTDINSYIDNNKIKNPEFVKSFIIAYNQAIKSSTFENLKSEIEKNLDTLLEAVKPSSKAVEQLKERINGYFTKLFLLFRKVNELAGGQTTKSPVTSEPTAEPQTDTSGGGGNKLNDPSQETTSSEKTKLGKPKFKGGPSGPKFKTNPKIGEPKFKSKLGEEEELEEAKKKNKYSKKASEFIGKEISHLKKDKGYSQERAVAAAINVAKEKGMKVGSKNKKSK